MKKKFLLVAILSTILACKPAPQTESDVQANNANPALSSGISGQTYIAISNPNSWSYPLGQAMMSSLKKFDLNFDRTLVVYLDTICPVVRISSQEILGIGGTCLNQFKTGASVYLMMQNSGSYLYKEGSKSASENKARTEWTKVKIKSVSSVAEGEFSFITMQLSADGGSLTPFPYAVPQEYVAKDNRILNSADIGCDENTFEMTSKSANIYALDFKVSGALIARSSKMSTKNSCKNLDLKGLGLFDSTSKMLIGLWVRKNSKGEDEFVSVRRLVKEPPVTISKVETKVKTEELKTVVTQDKCDPRARYTYKYQYSAINLKVWNEKEKTMKVVGSVGECEPIQISCSDSGHKIVNGNDVSVVASSSLLSKINVLVIPNELFINGMQLHPNNSWCKK